MSIFGKVLTVTETAFFEVVVLPSVFSTAWIYIFYGKDVADHRLYFLVPVFSLLTYLISFRRLSNVDKTVHQKNVLLLGVLSLMKEKKVTSYTFNKLDEDELEDDVFAKIDVEYSKNSITFTLDDN